MDTAPGPFSSGEAVSNGDNSMPGISLLVNLQTASVAGFAPLGVDAECYSRFRWGPDAMAEVVAHGAAHWPTVEAPEDFLANVTLVNFDADHMVAVARDAGAEHVVAVARDADGVAWWPCKRGVSVGHDVVGALADAARRAGVGFGVAIFHCNANDDSHGLDDVADLHARYVPDIVHVMRSNDRLAAAAKCVRAVTSGRDAPEHGQWELRLGYGPTLGFNRLELDDDLASTPALCETVIDTFARGGSILLDLPVAADGTVPETHVRAARQLGRWLIAHRGAFIGATERDLVDDPLMRFLVHPVSGDGRRTMEFIDFAPQASRSLAFVSQRTYPIVAAHGVSEWYQDAFGLHLAMGDPMVDARGTVLPAVVSLVIDATAPHAFALRGQRGSGTVHIGATTYATLTDALTQARPGDIVTLGPGVFDDRTETFPLHVPQGVTVEGPAPLRQPTALGVMTEADLWTEVIGANTLLWLDGDGATIKNIAVRSTNATARGDVPPVVHARDVANIAVESCQITGACAFDNVLDLSFSWNRIADGSLNVHGGSAITIMGSRFAATSSGQPTISLTDVRGARIEASSVRNATVGMRLHDVYHAQLGANAIAARHTGLDASHCTNVTISGNRITAMRGIWLDTCRDIAIQAHRAVRGDSAIGVFTSQDIETLGVRQGSVRIGMISDDPSHAPPTNDANVAGIGMPHGQATTPFALVTTPRESPPRQIPG